MIMITTPIAFSISALLLLVVATVPASPHSTTLPSFPGAEGFGAGAKGGRGGEVYEVNTLADDGPGSLRDAVRKPHRTIVFRVSGTIDLKSRLVIDQPNITLAGQTAPGDGICLRGRELFIKDTHDIIVRHLRCRPGDEQKAELDALTIWNAGDVIIDHCSLSWSTDSLNDVVKESGNVTVQWCILSEPLNKSVHVKGAHGYATGWDGRTKGGGSYHHNLIAHAASRAPRIGYYKLGRGLIDCRNNVIYNSGSSYGGETDDFNYVGNYYRPGPSTALLRPGGELFDIWSDDTLMYIADNVFEGNDRIIKDNAAGVTFKKGDRATVLVAKPFEVAPVKTDSAEEAYRAILDDAGATRPRRDPVDLRIIGDVKNRTGRIINSQADVGAWPELVSTAPPPDSDHDGMPDEWEKAHGLDPHNCADGAGSANDGYTHLEHYLNQAARR